MEVSESNWFKMMRDQRMQHLKKLNVISVARESLLSDTTGLSQPCSSEISCDLSSLSMELEPLSARLGLPVAAIACYC